MGEHDQNIALLALAIIAKKIQESLEIQQELGMLEQNPFSGEYVPAKSTHPLTDQQIADNQSNEVWDADMDVSDAVSALGKFRL